MFLPSWEPLLPIYYEPIDNIDSFVPNNYDTMEMLFKLDRRVQRENHARQIIFKDELEKFKFISTDHEIQLSTKETQIIRPR